MAKCCHVISPEKPDRADRQFPAHAQVDLQDNLHVCAHDLLHHGSWHRRAWPLVDRRQTHPARQPPHPLAVDLVPGGHKCRAILKDWSRRKVLACRVSNAMDVAFCVEALQGALARFGCPEIFNTDQGSNLPRLISPTCLGTSRCASPWTGKDAGWTMLSSSGYGAA